MTIAPDYPLNAWYAAAWSHELKPALLARTLLDRDVVLYRRADGIPVALDDACWHRLLPLSMGRLDGDEVVCGYHGLRFAADGRCTHMPGQEVNPNACVRSYPLVERHRFVWIWPGDPALADPALVPDLHWNDDPEWAGDGETIHALCNYKLVIDNLMDLTHETFVHLGSIGQDAVAESPFDTTHDERSVLVTRWMRDIEAPPFWEKQMRWKFPESATGNVDRWQIIQFEAPSTVVIDVGVAQTGTGAPEGDRSHGVNGRVLNTMTPERNGTCHYFWSFVRNYRLTDQSITTDLRNSVSRVFSEDEHVLAAQQRAADAAPDKRFRNLSIDVGGVWSRRLIDRMIETERAQPQVAAE